MNKRPTHHKLCGALLLTMACSSFADTISIRADEWYPMNGTPGAEKPGFMIEIAQRALEKGGHSIDYKLMPWERAIDETRKGSVDCVVGAYEADAPDLIFPDEAMGEDDTGFYVAKGNSYTHSMDALKSKKIGVIGGYAYDDGEIDAYIATNDPNVSISKGNDALEKNIKKLEAGRIDVVLESPPVINAKLAEMGLADKIVLATTLGDPSALYVACSPANPKSKEYAQLMGDGVRELRASGELAKIMGRYGLQDWK